MRREISKFSDLCRTTNDEKLINSAKEQLVKEHIDFKDFVETIDNIYSWISFFHIFAMILLNCSAGFMLINVKDLRFVILQYFFFIVLKN